jgi:LPS-assembly lipoprotein
LAVLGTLCLVLAGCGFRPLYTPRGSNDWDPDLAAIRVSPIHDRQGQILELALRENLNPGGVNVAPRWRLNTELTVSRSDLGIQRNATATTSEITASVSFTIIDIKTGRLIYTSTSRAVGDFDQIYDAYATMVASDSARDRALHQVADEMTLRLALFVRSQRPKP